MQGLTAAINASWLHRLMVEVGVLFPICETLHFIGLSLLIGSLLLIDLRALGFFKQMPFLPLHKLAPVALLGFGVNLVTGICFVAFDPATYFDNIAFLAKMALIPVAGINALIFEFMVFRPMKAGVQGVEQGAIAKITSILSLTIWALVLIGGRLIPFV